MKKFFLISILFISTLSFVPQPTFAADTTAPAEYTMLAPIPGLTTPGSKGTTNLTTFLPAVVKLMIGLATAFALLRIFQGGIQYLSTDAFSGKSAGKETITNALVGLLLTIGAYTLLYTINPRLVSFNLAIQNNNTAVDKYTGVNGSGVVIEDSGGDGSLEGKGASGSGCSQCVKLNTVVPQKPVGTGCKSPGPCVVDPFLAAKLYKLNDALNAGGLSWEVTEMYPPTAYHASSCHNPGPDSGKCVDAALRSTRTIPNIIKFMSAINKNVGPSFQWEVGDDTSADSLKTSIEQYIRANPGQFNVKTPTDIQSLIDETTSKVRVVKYATGEHVHINL